MMAFLVLLVGVLTVALVLVFWMQKKFVYWKNLGVPYAEPDFLYGNLKRVSEFHHEGLLTQKFYKEYKGKGPFVGVYFFLKPVAIPTDIELVKNILIKDFNFFHDRGLFYNERDDPLSANLFNLSGLEWKQMRNKLSPIMASGKMKMMFPAMLEVGRKLEKKIDGIYCSGEELNIKNLMARFTLDIIGTCAFGLETNTLEDDTSDFFRVGMSVFDNPKFGTKIMFLLNTFRKYGRILRFKISRDEVIRFDIVRKIVNYRLTNQIERKDFMQLLIKLHTSQDDDNFSFSDLLAQAFSFHAAGFEAPSTALQFCLYELACNPEIQDRTRNHINEVLEKHNGELSYEAFLDMKYLDQIVNETLRKHPPVGALLRETSKDYKVPGTQFTLEKDTTVFIPVYALHHDPEFYPNPSKFNPDNFTEEAVRGRPSVTFLPFGDGPRICIGARFAMMQVKIGLIAGLRKFKYGLSPKTRQPLKLLTKFFITHAEEHIWLNVAPLS